MNELDKTLRQNMNDLDDDVFEAYCKERKEPKYVVGRLYHYWDNSEDLGLGRVGRLKKILDGDESTYPYRMSDGNGYINIQAPIDFPDIYIPFSGDKCPEEIKDKRVTVWFSDMDAVKYVSASELPDRLWTSKSSIHIVAYLVHGDV